MGNVCHANVQLEWVDRMFERRVMRFGWAVSSLYIIIMFRFF